MRAGWIARNREPIALGAILLVAAALRFIGLGSLSIWHDEWTTILLGLERTPGDMLARLPALDATQAPLHPLLLQGWVRIFGSSDAAARAPSAICSLATVVLVYGIGKRLFNARVGLIGAWMTALNPLEVYHAREIRMYALLVTLTCASWLLLISFRTSSGLGRKALYALCLIAMMYNHPLGGLMVVALAVGYFVLRAELQLSTAAWLGTQAVAALGILPWVMNYLDHPPENVSPYTTRDMVEWLDAFTGGRIEAVAGAIVLIGIGLRAVFKKQTSERRGAALLFAWLLVPALLLMAYSILAHPLFSQRRYLLFVAPAYLLLIARGLVALPRPACLAMLALTTAMTAQVLPNRVFNGVSRADWRSAAEAIKRIDPASMVVMRERKPPAMGPLSYYVGPGIRLRLLADERKDLAEGRVAPASSIWYVSRFEERRVETTLPQALAEHYVIERRLDFHELTVTYLRVRPDARTVGASAGPARR